MLFMPFIAVAAAYAMTSIVSDTGSHQLYASDAIHDAAITTDSLSEYKIQSRVPRISESSSLPVSLHPLPTPKPNDLDIDELNRRLIAEGLEPIIIEEEPPPPGPTPAYVLPPDPVIEEPPPPPEPLEIPESVFTPHTEPENPIPAPVVPSPPKELTQTPPSKSLDIFTEASYRLNPEPPYPKAAERKGLEGVVILRVHIGTDGNPVAVNLVRSSGYSILDKSAIDAVRNTWHFNPATRNGQPVEAWVEVPIIFTLD